MSYLPVMMMRWDRSAAGGDRRSVGGRGVAVRGGLRCTRRRTGIPGGDRVTRLREIAAPFVAAVPAGARVRTRLRVSPQDTEILAAVGRHLGSLAGRDLAARCAEGRL